MKLKTLRVIGIVAMLFCAFQLGRIDANTAYLKRIDTCVKLPEHPSIQEFYGHGFKKENLAHTIWNHAVAHNDHIYMKCIFKEIRNE